MYLHEWLIFMVNVGKHMPYMDVLKIWKEKGSFKESNGKKLKSYELLKMNDIRKNLLCLL